MPRVEYPNRYADMLQQETQIQAHALAAPSEEALIASLSRVLTAARAQEVWVRACASVGIDRPGPSLGLGELSRIASYLAAQAELVGVLGVSLRIRIETYACLAGLPSPFSRGEEQ